MKLLLARKYVLKLLGTSGTEGMSIEIVGGVPHKLDTTHTWFQVVTKII